MEKEQGIIMGSPIKNLWKLFYYGKKQNHFFGLSIILNIITEKWGLYPEFKRLMYWMYMGIKCWLLSNIFSQFTSNIIDFRTLVVESYLKFYFLWIIVMKGPRLLSFFSKGKLISEGNFGVSKSSKM